MALLWSKQQRNVHYEVRSAGNTVRLYTNGAFHSEYNPSHLFTGGVWDLMTVAAMHRIQPPTNLLMLGVGGGTVIHQLLALLPEVQVTGVEIDRTHLTIARRWFGLKDKRVTLIQADAREYLAECNTRFDVVIDDVFVHAAGDPQRPFAADHTWFKLLHRALRQEGTLIQNHLGRADAATALAIASQAGLPGEYARLFSTPRYENRILALYPQRVDAVLQRAQLKQLTPGRLGKRLVYQSSSFNG